MIQFNHSSFYNGAKQLYRKNESVRDTKFKLQKIEKVTYFYSHFIANNTSYINNSKIIKIIEMLKFSKKLKD